MNFKALLILVSLYSIAIPLKSQTIDPSWFPRPGVSYDHVLNFDDSNAMIPEPIFGMDQEWDFSQVDRTMNRDEISYVDPEGTLFADLYPDATVVKIMVTDFAEWYWYYRVTQDTVYEEGSALVDVFFSGDTLTMIHPKDQHVQAFSGYSLGDSIWTFPGRFNLQFVGTGTVMTRIGTYENCILFKDEAPSVGTGAYTYRWFHESLMKEVLNFSPEASDHPFPKVTYLVDYQDEVSSTENERSSLNWEISYYSNNLIVDDVSKNNEVIIHLFDIEGRSLFTKSVELTQGRNEIEFVDLNAYPAGFYPVLVMNKEDGRFSTTLIKTIDY